MKYAKIVNGEIDNVEVWRDSPPAERGEYRPLADAIADGIPFKARPVLPVELTAEEYAAEKFLALLDELIDGNSAGPHITKYKALKK